MVPDREDLYQVDPGAAKLDQGILLHYLDGFIDAGAAGRLLTAHLLGNLDHKAVVTFDVDRLIDYRSRRASVDKSVQVVQQDSLVKLRRARVDLIKVPPIRHHAHSLLRVGLVANNNRRAPVFHPASPCPKVPGASRSGEPGHAAMAASARAVRTACFSESMS